MSARSVCSGTRPSRYHSVRAISAPPRRPAQLMRMPSAPRRIADCTARFMARRNATRRSSCWAIDWATSVASISGLRTSTMLRCVSDFGHLRQLLAKLLDVGALLADDQARTRRVDRDAALLVRTLDHDLGDRRPASVPSSGYLRILRSSCSSLPYSPLFGEPAEIPGAVDAEAKTDRIDFLTHYAASSFFNFANDDREVRERLLDARRRGHGHARGNAS